MIYHVNPIHDGGEGPKRPPISFSPVTSTNARISPSKISGSTKTTPQNTVVFLVKSLSN